MSPDNTGIICVLSSKKEEALISLVNNVISIVIPQLILGIDIGRSLRSCIRIKSLLYFP